VAFTVATTALLDFQLTKFVMLEVTPPLKEPVAANCCCLPVFIEAMLGVTVIEIRPDNDPEPLRDAVCGLFEPLSMTVSVPVRVPKALGTNLTLIVH
jgi:hypothetical protein